MGKEVCAVARRSGSDVPQLPPDFVQPMDPVEVSSLPHGRGWIFEPKWDGYRAILVKLGPASVRLFSRKHKELTRSYPSIVSAARSLAVETCVLDGEIVGLDRNNQPSFKVLQRRSGPIVYVAYDLMYSDGEDCRARMLLDRRARLEQLVHGSGIQFSGALGNADEARQFVDALGLEGIVGKRAKSAYVSGATEDWVKWKRYHQQEFVIGGFSADGLSVTSLLVGYFEDGRLQYAAKVHAGFTAYERREWLRRLRPLKCIRCPFAQLPVGRSQWENTITEAELSRLSWVTPQWVVQIRFLDWTEEGQLRHAYYLGVREDKEAHEVHREPG
jgi:bifunctional non-homologous end joining protein LigD